MMPRPKIVTRFNCVALNMATALNKSVMPPAPDLLEPLLHLGLD